MIRPPLQPTYPQQPLAPTRNQELFLDDLKAKLRIPSAPLDDYARGKYGRAVAELDRREMSALLTEMLTWKDAPDVVRRAMGQLDLF